MFFRHMGSNGSLEWLDDGDLEGPAFRVLKGAALTLLVAWTLGANLLVMVVLKTNVRLQTVPNLLVGNLAFSDICLSAIVLPGAALVALSDDWPLGRAACEIWLSADILCCTASIWNMSTIGLDRYWAITSPVAYLNRRNSRTAFYMIAAVWLLSALISIAPFLGWKSAALHGNHVYDNVTDAYQCMFLDLPAYTIYSATGSFLVPTLLMFFVYYKIYKAFEDHRARQIYRQKVIRRHIESTILHEISHVLPTSDEFAKSEDDDSEEDSESSNKDNLQNEAILEEEEGEEEESEATGDATRHKTSVTRPPMLGHRGILSRTAFSDESKSPAKAANGGVSKSPRLAAKKAPTKQRPQAKRVTIPERKPLTFERVQRHQKRKERNANRRPQLNSKPAAISAAKERRGVRVLGIILGCFTVCWTPFFFMYVLGQFCDVCRPNIHIEQFITWLGYSNSAMNPIIYTVFNRDYQNALKRLFNKRKR